MHGHLSISARSRMVERPRWLITGALLVLLLTGGAARAVSPLADVPLATPTAAPILYFDLLPVAVSASGSSSVTLTIHTDGTITSAQLALASGNTRPLAFQGNGVFTITLTHSEALYGYTSSDVNHNFVGFLRVYNGSVQVGQYNIFVNVLDEQTPPVPIQTVLSGPVRKSPHVANLVIPTLDPANPDLAAISQAFYRNFGDDYDFLAIITLPERNSNRYHFVTRNQVQGIGLAQINNDAVYGSAGRLKGITAYPLTNYFDLAERASIHEIGHQWINYLKVPQLQGVTPHWPVSSLARGVMGWQAQGNAQGLEFPWQLTPVAGGNYRCDNAGVQRDFNAMELYLMGLAPATSVPSYFVFTNQGQECSGGAVLAGPVQNVTVSNVIAAYGPRLPAYGSAQTKFRIATVVAGKDRFLTDQEMAFFDHFAARGSLSVPVPYTSGRSSGIAWPFAVATHRQGCLITTLDSDGECAVQYMPLVGR